MRATTTSQRPARARRGATTRLLALVLAPVLALPLAACTGPDIPPAKDAAQAFVGALKSGSFKDVDLHQDTSGDPTTQRTEILTPLLEATGADAPTVEVHDVKTVETGDKKGKEATAELQWTWALGGDATWTYLTKAELSYVEPTKDSKDKGHWSTQWQPDILVPGLKPGERVKVDTVEPTRAPILDGTGEPLVADRDVLKVGIDKTHAKREEWDASARALAALVTAGGINVDADAYAAKVAKAGAKAFVQLVVVRAESPQIDIGSARLIKGVSAIPDTQALAPTSTFAKAILGSSGEATAEIIDASKGRVKKGDITGLSGLQKQYDAQLAGSRGVVVNAIDPNNDQAQPRELYKKDAVNGTALQTTFDVPTQEHAEAVLSSLTDTAAAIVAIRPSTGDVLAAASSPGSKGLDTALLGKYAPGSTFKVVDSLAFGRKGITPDTTLPCTPTITVNGKEFQNVPEYPASALGDIPLRTAIAHSCNTAMISQHDAVAQQDLVTAGLDLGFGVKTPVGAPAFYGNVPTDATATQHAATMIGQDRVEASPFTMARIAASVAAGKRVDPVLVKPATPAEAKDIPTSAFTADEAAVLRELMAGVVQDGSANMLKGVPGIVGAKTGTAQFGTDGAQQHTWMIAIAGDLAVCVFVEVGDRGSSTSGPLMLSFLTES